MSSIFDRMQSICAPTKYLVNGYIRICEDELFRDLAMNNPYYNIPQLINNYCMLFYERFTWYKEQYGPGLNFLSDTEVILGDVSKSSYCWTTCMFENVIDGTFSDKFSITFTEKLPDETADFYLGYTTGVTLETSILNWNHQLGAGRNRYTSRAWLISDGKLSFSGHELEAEYVGHFGHSTNDWFKLMFDFETNKVMIYHNDTKKDSRDLNMTKLWVGLSMFYQRETIKMIEYKYN